MARRYRLIEYDGPDDWVEQVFRRSLDGCIDICGAKITAVELKVENMQPIIMGLKLHEARNKPASWPAKAFTGKLENS